LVCLHLGWTFISLCLDYFTQTEVFVGGLSYDASEDDITQLFSQYGEVKNLKCLTNQDGSFKGACFVCFSSNAEAMKAIELNGGEHMGRTLKVNLANEKPPAARPDGGCNTVFVGNINFESTEDTPRRKLRQAANALTG